MPYRGSPEFVAYARTLRRVFWADFVDSQMSQTLGAPNRLGQTAQPNNAEPRMAVYPFPTNRNER